MAASTLAKDFIEQAQAGVEKALRTLAAAKHPALENTRETALEMISTNFYTEALLAGTDSAKWQDPTQIKLAAEDITYAAYAAIALGASNFTLKDPLKPLMSQIIAGATIEEALAQADFKDEHNRPLDSEALLEKYREYQSLGNLVEHGDLFQQRGTGSHELTALQALLMAAAAETATGNPDLSEELQRMAQMLSQKFQAVGVGG